MPALGIALALGFGLSGPNLVIVTVGSAVPASSSAYVLARQSDAARDCARRVSAISADQFAAVSTMVCTTAARLLRPCRTTVSQIEWLR